jgi:hypothetical protein
MIGIDKEVKDWWAALNTVGLDADAYEIVALSHFVKRCRNAGLWTKFIEVIPFCGTTYMAALYKLKVATGLSRLMVPSGTMNSTYYQQRRGMTGKNSIRVDTGCFTANHWLTTDGSDGMMILSYDYEENGATSKDEYQFGNGIDSNNFSWDVDASSVKPRIHSSGAMAFGSQTIQNGIYVGNRPSSTSIYGYRNGVSLGSGVVAGVGLSATNNIRVLGRHSGQQSSAWQHFVAYGEGFTNAECVTLTSLVMLLLDELRRPVNV